MKTVTKRWGEISQLVLALSGTAFAVAAVNNARFVSLWTAGRVHWDDSNHWLFGLYSYVYAAATLAFGSVGLTKSIGSTRFVSLAQALVTAALAVPMSKLWGFTGLMFAATLPFTFGMIHFGIRYLASITGSSYGPLALTGIIRPSMALPIAVLAAWTCAHLSRMVPGYYGLVVSSATGCVLALAAMMFVGVSSQVREEIRSMASRSLKRILPGPRAEA
jgi:hypothetical protein